jgi:hypothetical protein
MDWYNASVGVLAKQKSTADSSDEISYKPSGNLAELFTNELWYAVESPLDFGDRNLMIMTPEVNNYAETHGDGAIKQEMKLVVLRNKETGETYSFIMAVVPELDYMLRKGDELDKSTYLSPNSDFDGYIFFYTLDGELINGWLYKGGKVTGGINFSGEGPRTKILVAAEMVVRSCHGIQGMAGIECGWGPEIYYYDNGVPYVNGNPGVNIQYPYIGGGGGNGSNTGNNPKLKLTPTPFDRDKKPEVRTDCTAQSEQNAKSLENDLKAAGIIQNITSLRNFASSKSTEYGMLINVNSEGYIYSGAMQQGTSSGVDMKIGQNTAYSVHTHYSCSGGIKGPSARDIYNTIDAVGKSDYYEGTVIFACDGSEYYIHVEDYNKAEILYKERGLFATDSKDKFLNAEMNDIYKDAKDNMLKQGYSEDNAHIYTMMSFLDWQDSGIKIYIKESASGQFKEIKVDKVYNADGRTYNYKLSKCK